MQRITVDQLLGRFSLHVLQLCNHVDLNGFSKRNTRKSRLFDLVNFLNVLYIPASKPIVRTG